MKNNKTEFTRHAYELTEVLDAVMHFKIIENSPDKILPEVLKLNSKVCNAKNQRPEFTLIFKDKTGWGKELAVNPSASKPNIYHTSRVINGKKSLLVLKVDINTKLLFIDVFNGFYPDNPGLSIEAIGMHPYYL
ncbi:hypothetical protein [Salegentibacter sp. Hel_I_6]|uniref:hypothetical protein n=1 Tax=Salegentibacter sp. Hel_I_6 TaxID=1250278 RepID=UPI00056B0957|nr:hypothetical protein [Salegentibacter sp. Hel_I_6]